MPKQRKNYSSDLKARVALEAIKGQKTANEIAAEYAVHPTQIAQWKKQAMDGLPDLFSTRRSDQAKSEEALVNSLYQHIGQLKVQVDWLEKKPSGQKRRLREDAILREERLIDGIIRRKAHEKSQEALQRHQTFLSSRTVHVSRVSEPPAPCCDVI
jgi:transposase